MEGNEPFFKTAKKFHNLLQGPDGKLMAEEITAYVDHSWNVSKAIMRRGVSADIWVMHDPQSLALAAFLPQSQASMWVCHIDTTAPNQSAITDLLHWFSAYSLILFSMPAYILHTLDLHRTRVAPPAIDPLQPKNLRLKPAIARKITAKLGIDPGHWWPR